jgi:hypothetical protein
MAVWMVSTVGACQSEDADEQAQLQALLHDEALQQVPPSAVLPPTEGASSPARRSPIR